MSEGSVHAIHVAYITRIGAFADDSIVVRWCLTWIWCYPAWVIAWIYTEIPVFLPQLCSYFFKGFLCTHQTHKYAYLVEWKFW